jgi:hypothetical protein
MTDVIRKRKRFYETLETGQDESPSYDIKIIGYLNAQKGNEEYYSPVKGKTEPQRSDQ